MVTSRIFYGWVVVGAGIVITCIGMGAMLSLGIFLHLSVDFRLRARPAAAPLGS